MVHVVTKVDARSRDDVLDAWRGVACMMVFTWHTGVALWNPPLALFGCTGVHLFFVLSGYLIYRPFADAMIRGTHHPSIRRFYARRFFRIYPAYLAALLAFVLLRYATGTQPPDASNVLTHVLLIFNYVPSQNLFSINPVFWSLAIEVQFYVLLPVACWVLPKLLGHQRGMAAALSVPAAFIAVGLTGRVLETKLTYPCHTHFQSVFSFLDLFGAGMIVAFLQSIQRPPVRSIAVVSIFVLGLAGFVAANDWFAAEGDWLTRGSRFYAVLFPFAICVSASMMLLALISWPLAGGRLPSFGLLRRVGTVSYSLYLYHVGVQFVVFRLIRLDGIDYSTKALLYAAIALVPSLLVAWVMYQVFEAPGIRYAARFKDGGRVHGNPSASAGLDGLLLQRGAC